MNKLILTLALATLSGAGISQAGTYTETVVKEDMCEAYGEIAMLYYDRKQKGMSASDAGAEVGEYGGSAWYIVYNSTIGSRKAAYRRVWANCMDKK